MEFTSTMEEELIQYVRANPILYDLKNKQYRNHAARKETWDEIGEKLGKSGDLCKHTWNKLRNAYTNAINRRTSKRGQTSKRMGKWTFEDQMSFLPTVVHRQPHGDSSGTSQYETKEEDDDASDFEVVEAKIENALLSQPENDSEPAPIGQSNIVTSHDSSTYQSLATPQRDSMCKHTRMEATLCELVSIMKNNSRTSSELLSPNNSTVSQACVHDENEMFFLSLAKFIKKLNPANRIRVKSEVSQIVFQAEYRNLKNPEQYSQPHQLPTASPTTSEHSLLSETGITNTDSQQMTYPECKFKEKRKKKKRALVKYTDRATCWQ